MAIRERALANLVNTMNNPLPDPSFWRGRRVLLTGHTGFKGAWMTLWLTRMGAEVSALALAPSSAPNLYNLLGASSELNSQFADIRDFSAVKQVVDRYQPEIVIHLAAQALVRASYLDPLATFATNVMGTANLLEALRGVPSVKLALLVTTDKVYRNREQLAPYPETAELGGHDPYSASKAASELVIASYRAAFLTEQGVTIAVARAGNVIGGGDWSEDRLLPDAICAWQRGDVLQIRRPDAVRPWQHVLEPLSAYLCLAEHAYAHPEAGTAWNFGPTDAASVREVVQLARAGFGRGEIDFASEIIGPHEAGLLALDVTQAQHELGIVSRWDLKTSVLRSVEWYRDYYNGEDARQLCLRDIETYLSLDS
ncbi:MAG: CDP-glucose 4,6-dehydratase [Undibacterium sp.]|uniref:CDP-glucose 4,6-dehydratase n=1 Tax=Undibacterium sp. TaxID=1914977 RepID=UPI00271AB039|nr:CDP-glucose 4,6-dehydratase [Undibacterium sp.]MDO8651592.1 CDP-glucose 4,6-dehydratase [Undibacterium sp.]